MNSKYVWFGVGILVGVIAANQIRKLPGAGVLPTI